MDPLSLLCRLATSVPPSIARYLTTAGVRSARAAGSGRRSASGARSTERAAVRQEHVIRHLDGDLGHGSLLAAAQCTILMPTLETRYPKGHIQQRVRSEIDTYGATSPFLIVARHSKYPLTSTIRCTVPVTWPQ